MLTPKIMPDQHDYKEKGRRLSPVLSKIILQAEEDNRQILSSKDFVEFYDISDGYARKMIAQLVENGWLLRVGAGKYQLLPAKTGLAPYPNADKFVAAGQLSPGSFIAYGSAAEYHGLTTQLFQTVTVATTNRGRVWDGEPVRIVYIHVSEANFVGFQKTSKGPNVIVATVERTIIDAVNRPDLCGGISDVPEIIRRGRSLAKIDKILEYLPTYGSKSLAQRLGYLLESFQYELSNKQVKQLQKICAGNTAYLFPPNQLGTNKRPTYNGRWRLVINADGFIPSERQE